MHSLGELAELVLSFRRMLTLLSLVFEGSVTIARHIVVLTQQLLVLGLDVVTEIAVRMLVSQIV